MTKTQKVKVNSQAVNSLQGNRRFSFPTATAINNQSQLVDINANAKIRQGVVNRSSAVTSNGITVSNVGASSFGGNNASTQIPSALFIEPKVPSGLTQAEINLFNDSYPPLPSTDSRTRSAPYA